MGAARSSARSASAAAIGSILLFLVLALYLIYNRLIGVDNMKLG